MSIRLRLTLLYSAILALTLIAFSTVLYFTLAQEMRTLVKQRLEDEAKVLTAEPQFRIDRIVFPGSKFTPRGAFVQTVSLDGAVQSRTPNLGDLQLPLSPDSLRTVRDDGYSIETQLLDNERFLIYSKLLIVQGRPFGIIQLARSLEEQEQSLQALQRSLIVGSSIAIVIAFGVGWVLAGTTLRPINRIERTAYAIGAERDFDRRVDHVGPHDEVGRLATTFNTMLTELQTAYRQVEQALQAQRRFVADASHELRTPLTTIRGNVGLLQRQPPIEPEDRVAALGDMADETDRLIRLVNDLLVLARADAGRLWRNEPVAIRPLIEDLCRQAQLLEPERRIRCEDILDLAVVGNRDALKQVLLILLDNALKFTPVDGEVGFATAVDDGRVNIAVYDTGPGIAAAALPHIFERFYRGDSARTGAGAGLGLSIAKTLMEAQRGTIAVESAAGRGSVFRISLPQAPVRPEPEVEPALSGVVGA